MLLMAPCHSQKTDLSNEVTFMQFDDAHLKPIHFKVGAILEKKCPRKFLICISKRYYFKKGMISKLGGSGRFSALRVKKSTLDGINTSRR